MLRYGSYLLLGRLQVEPVRVRDRRRSRARCARLRGTSASIRRADRRAPPCSSVLSAPSFPRRRRRRGRAPSGIGFGAAIAQWSPCRYSIFSPLSDISKARTPPIATSVFALARSKRCTVNSAGLLRPGSTAAPRAHKARRLARLQADVMRAAASAAPECAGRCCRNRSCTSTLFCRLCPCPCRLSCRRPCLRLVLLLVRDLLFVAFRRERRRLVLRQHQRRKRCASPAARSSGCPAAMATARNRCWR